MTAPLALKKVQREQVDAADEVFKPWGLRTEVVMGGEHAKLYVYDPTGRRWVMTITCSPKNRTSAGPMAKRSAQKLLRQINETLGVTKL